MHCQRGQNSENGSMILKIACAVAVVVFGFFTFLQFNDESQYGTDFWQGWVIFYGVVVAIAIVTFFKHLPVWVYMLGAIGALAAAGYRSTVIEWDGPILCDATNPAGNETGGFLIVGIWFLYLAAAAWGARKKAI